MDVQVLLDRNGSWVGRQRADFSDGPFNSPFTDGWIPVPPSVRLRVSGRDGGLRRAVESAFHLDAQGVGVCPSCHEGGGRPGQSNPGERHSLFSDMKMNVRVGFQRPEDVSVMERKEEVL